MNYHFKNHKLLITSLALVLLISMNGCKSKNVAPSAADFFPKDTKFYVDLKIDGASSAANEIKKIIEGKIITENSDPDDQKLMEFLNKDLKEFTLSLALEKESNDTDENKEDSIREFTSSIIDNYNVYISIKTENIDNLFQIIEPALEQDESNKNIYKDINQDKYVIKNADTIFLTHTKENAEKLLNIMNGSAEALNKNENFLKDMKEIKKSNNTILTYFINNSNGEIVNFFDSKLGQIEKTNDKELQIHEYTSLNEEKSNAANFNFTDVSSKAELYKFIPKDSLSLYLEIFNFKKQSELLKQNTSADKLETGKIEIQETLNSTLGLDEKTIKLVEDLFASLDQSAALAINTSSTRLTPELTFIAEINKNLDKTQALATIKDLGTQIQTAIDTKTKEMTLPIAIKYEFKDLDKGAYFVLTPDLSMANLLLGVENPLELNISIGIYDNKVFFSTYKNFADIFANKDLTLKTDKDFKSYIGIMGKKSPLMYVKFDALSTYLTKIGETLKTEDIKEIANIVSNFNTIFVSNKSKDYELSTESKILLNDNWNLNLIKGLSTMIPKIIEKYFTETEEIQFDEFSYQNNECNFDQSSWAYNYMNDITGTIVTTCHNETDLITGKEFISYFIATLYYNQLWQYVPSEQGFADINQYDWATEYLVTAEKQGLINENFQANTNITYQDALDIIAKSKYVKLDELTLESKTDKNDFLNFADSAELIYKSQENYYTHYDDFINEPVEEIDYANYISHNCNFEDVDWADSYANSLFDFGILKQCFDENAYIKNSEFIELIVKIIYSNTMFAYSPTTESPYLNLDSNYWAFKYIKTAYDNGLFTDLYEDAFDADLEIQIGDAMKIISNTTYLTNNDISEKVFNGKIPRNDKNLSFKDAIKILYELNNAYYEKKYPQ